MKLKTKNRFDITAKTFPVEMARKLPEAQIRDLADTRSLEDFANRLNAARKDYRQFCIIVIISATALVFCAYLTGYLISKL